MKGKKTKEQFIADAIKVHGNKYDYSKVEYKGCRVEVEIICPNHGSFWQKPINHLKGRGCIKCHNEEYSKRLRRTTDEFVAQARIVHGDKYNYDKTEYVNKRTKVCITCPKHGDFWQNAQSHLNGCGCKECMKESFRITYENFIERAKEIHGDRYDYSLITKENFNGASSFVDIICPSHGVFRQKAINHLNGNGCPQCAYDLLHDSKAMPKEEFLRRVNELYGDRFDMSKADFVNVNTPITVICKEHGEFSVKPRYFLRGYGCPRCSISRGEEKVMLCLDKLGINYETQYKINNEFLFCENKRMYLDFFIPSMNVAIEYQGEQHYRPTGFVDNEERFAHQQEKDNAVRQYCKEHKIKLIEIPYTEYDNIEEILTKELNVKKHD